MATVSIARPQQTTILQLDHLVILVRDLEMAITDYRGLGFNVVVGGEHADGATHNALIAFADGTYLELIAFRREAREHRWWRHVATGEGLIDFALLPSDTAAAVAAARERGLIMDGPFEGGRVRPDGVELRWRIAQPSSPDLPFLCGDITPRSLRVPSGEAHVHPNGAQGIASLVIAVADLVASSARYQALLGQPAASRNASDACWQLGTTSLVLSPRPDREGPRAVVIETDRSAQTMDETRAHGVEMTLSTR